MNIEQLRISRTIIEQLGGQKFMVMTGVKEFHASEDGVSFHLPGGGGFAKHGINRVTITLDPSDTYTMIFYRMRRPKLTVIAEHHHVYFDSLREIFTRETGLETSL